MFKKGEIVYHDEIVFLDGILDTIKKRSCIVLFELEFNGNLYCVTCPISSQINNFNKHPDKFLLVTEVVYSYHRLNFAKIDHFFLKSVNETHKTGRFVSEICTDKIIEKLKESKIEEYAFLRNYLMKNEETLLPKIKKKL